jgi:transposase
MEENLMLTKRKQDIREQVQIVTMDALVPKDHILRLVDEAIDFDFIYDLVEDQYCADNGRPSLDPVVLIKLPVIQYLCGIRSMRQTIRDVEVNIAYRWFLGLDFNEAVPHFTTFGKNYSRRFKDTDLFEQIFMKILEQCVKAGYVDQKTLFIDGTHVKARANRKKSQRVLVKKTVRHYETALQEEIARDREAHGKRPLRDKNESDDPDDSSSMNASDEENQSEQKTGTAGEYKDQKTSTSDPESGWFHKGEHKSVFAYSIQCACDQNGWITNYTIGPGNEHDSSAFWELYHQLMLKESAPQTIVADAGYKTPAIARQLILDGITPNFPYTRPHTKDGFFYKKDYAFDEYYDCYICPNDQVLKYSTTNREGYREYKSDPEICQNCPDLKKCTQSKNHTKVVTRHVWADYLEQCEDIRHTTGRKEEYQRRKETIERIFGSAKEHHGMRYTQYVGKARVAMQVGLTLACLNMKKLANLLYRKRMRLGLPSRFILFFPFSAAI